MEFKSFNLGIFTFFFFPNKSIIFLHNNQWWRAKAIKRGPTHGHHMLQDGDYVTEDLWGFHFLEQVKWPKQWPSSFIKITYGALQIGLYKRKVFDVNLITARKSKEEKKRDG